MNYQKTIDYLFSQLPMYQREGKQAFKKNLDNILELCAELDNPQDKFKSIHIAGTNGKGSTAHILSAILQTAGYKTGLYTSPHYRDFRERIKINGEYISEESVIQFVENNKNQFDNINPSFFEMTVAMAFHYFADQGVDIAIIETGLGGRLDSTNVIKPLLSVITNIGIDHEAMLGNSFAEIASEKAGIIKSNTPVIIGETHPETRDVFLKKAKTENAQIIFAEKAADIKQIEKDFYKSIFSISSESLNLVNFKNLEIDLTGNYQLNNLRTALVTCHYLNQKKYVISKEHITKACKNTEGICRLLGRWKVLETSPLIICDSGHNSAGLKYVMQELKDLNKKLHIILGTVNDKDLNKIFPLFPEKAKYYFCKAKIPRGMEAKKLQESALKYKLKGSCYDSVKEALQSAKLNSKPNDCIFIGGSIFVVAEVI